MYLTYQILQIRFGQVLRSWVRYWYQFECSTYEWNDSIRVTGITYSVSPPIIKLFPERFMASRDEKIAQNTTCFNILIFIFGLLVKTTVRNELRPPNLDKLHFIAMLAQAEK